MKTATRFAVCILTVATLALSGCSKSGSQEKVADDVIGQMDKMTEAVVSVKDKSTAEKAAVALKEVAVELKSLAAKAKELGEPNSETKAKIEAKLKAKQEEMMKKILEAQATLRQAGPEAAAIFAKGMAEFGSAMQEVAKSLHEAK